jgi:GNAT superfamily N-acetyltransferase
MSGNDGLLAEADRNMVAMFRALVGVAGGPPPVEDGPLTLLASGAPIGFFNPAFVFGPVEDPVAMLDRVSDHYRELSLPFALLFRDEVTPGLAQACEDAGMVEHWRMPLMALDPIPPAAPDAPAGLEVVDVDRSTMQDYGDTLCASFGIPRSMIEPLLDGRLLDAPGFFAQLGLLDGEPIATAGVFVTGDLAGVYNIGTVEAARGKGIGEAITWAAVMAGRAAGATRSILQASEMGEPVYRRMGYETPSRYRQFEPAPG